MISALFDKTTNFVAKALDLISMRHELIASNIANQDTPNYKPKDINFKKELENFLSAQESKNLYLTDPHHLTNIPDKGKNVEIIVGDGSNGYDNNSVDPESEMAKMTTNTILYDTASHIISNKFKMLRYVIQEEK